MAAITLPTSIRATSTTKIRLVQYGATIALGNPLYLDSADNEHKLGDCNGTAAVATVLGLAITPGVDGGYGVMATSGSVQLVGSTMVVGTTYCVGQTAGSIVPESDLTTSDYVTRIGTAASATELLLSIEATGIVHA